MKKWNWTGQTRSLEPPFLQMLTEVLLYLSHTPSVGGVIGAHLDGLLWEKSHTCIHLDTCHFKSETGRRPFCNSAGPIIWNISDSLECSGTHSHFGSINWCIDFSRDKHSSWNLYSIKVNCQALKILVATFKISSALTFVKYLLPN